ncbi:hypothetical protein BGZ83_000631 [Gryganskiella cystojenkinii]|nr:hypothetical protein BGZ83_000631 [Gryganskiella cystojenkinii]
MASINKSLRPTSRPRCRRIFRLLLLLAFISLFLHVVSAADDDNEEESDSSGYGHAGDPELTGSFPPTPTPVTSPDSGALPVPPSDITGITPTKTKTPKIVITLPTVLFVPPATNINPNATDPFFPPGSESCQKCKYFYPKLKECNQIAKQTLGRLPRMPGEKDGTYGNLSTVASSTNINFNSNSAIPTSSFVTASSNTTATAEGNSNLAPAEFTTLMPFLQCICPSQGLAATKVCLTCFRISNQRNFLDELVLQNVSNSLAAFQEACLDSGDGAFVPPAANKGQSASNSPTQVILSSWISYLLPLAVLLVGTLFL